MSIIQSIIASAVRGSTTPTASLYPVPGVGYPLNGGGINANAGGSITGYYESILTETSGLWRKTYEGEAIGNIDNVFSMDSNFPELYNNVRSEADPFVGFGPGDDVASNFSMEWIGYFKPNSTENYVFAIDADDHALMWIGETAVSGFTVNNTVVAASNYLATTVGYDLVAGRYYPVRIRYTENGGGNKCTVYAALNNTTYLLTNDSTSGNIGQFVHDVNAVGSFPTNGLIV